MLFIECLLCAVAMIGILYTYKVYWPHNNSAKEGITLIFLMRKLRPKLGYHGLQGIGMDLPILGVLIRILPGFLRPALSSSLPYAHLCPMLAQCTAVGGLCGWLGFLVLSSMWAEFSLIHL